MDAANYHGGLGGSLTTGWVVNSRINDFCVCFCLGGN